MTVIVLTAIALCLTIPAGVMAFLFYSDWEAHEAERARDNYSKRPLTKST